MQNQINPSNENHNTLECDVKSYLNQKGFMEFVDTYHEIMTEDLINRLSSIFSFSSLYIRTKPDGIAIHKNNPIVFLWECKTHVDKDYHDITIELIPFIFNKLLSTIGVKILYCYRDPFINKDYGFWSDNMPTIRDIKLPSRTEYDNLNHNLKEMCLSVLHLNESKIQTISSCNGSGDPFIIIDESTKLMLPHWKILIDNFVSKPIMDNDKKPNNFNPPPPLHEIPLYEHKRFGLNVINGHDNNCSVCGRKLSMEDGSNVAMLLYRKSMIFDPEISVKEMVCDYCWLNLEQFVVEWKKGKVLPDYVLYPGLYSKPLECQTKKGELK